MQVPAGIFAAAALLIVPAHGDNVFQIRVTTRVIEVPRPVLTGWLATPGISGAELHRKAVELALAGKAEIVDTSVLTTRKGGRASLESIREIIFPIEAHRPDFTGFTTTLKGPPFPPVFRYQTAISAFGTRNTGIMMEIEPTYEAGLVELRISQEFIDYSSLITWTRYRDQWGDASVRTPVFTNRRVRTSVTLASGRFELLKVTDSTPEGPVAALRSLMTFVRADELSILPSP